ncbi:MAG TPA: transcription elongation factor GreA [Dehalococcoidia bacterium]
MATRKTAVSTSLVDAAAQYIATLGQDAAQDAQPAVHRFVQWFGPARPAAELKSADVERFVEESAGRGGSQGRSVEAVRPFLAYLKKVGLTSTNLSTAIKLRRAESEAVSAMDGNAVQMTRTGFEALQRELAQLKESRTEIALELEQAMADKDFRENAPLDAAREKQAHVEARIRRIEEQLRHAAIVEGASTGAARVGSHVVVLNLGTNQETTYQLVSPSEVNPKEGKISILSPVGKALVDRVKGEEVSVNVPAGMLKLRVESVEG